MTDPVHDQPMLFCVELRSSRWSLGFEVADLEPYRKRLAAAGAEIIPPREHHEGFNELVTHDPDGNRLRLFAWPRQT